MSDVKANKRAALYTRPERGVCAYCLASATGWDHVVPKASGGTNNADNLLPACKACNDLKATNSLLVFLVLLAHRRAARSRGLNTGKPYPCERCGEWVFRSRKHRQPMNLRHRSNSPRTPHVCETVA